MATEKILDFDFSNVVGFTSIYSTGLIQDSGSGAIPTYKYNFQVRFTIDSGLFLVDAPHIKITYKKQGSDTLYIFDSRDRYENGIYYCSYESSIIDTRPINIISVECTGLASQYAPFNSDFPLLRVHKVDLTTQNALTAQRFYGALQDYYNIVDLGQFIVSLVRYPFSVDIGENADIVLGFANTNLQAPVLTKRIYTFTIFDGIISGIFGDSRDNNNVNITALLPFHGKYIIDSALINKNVKIIYEIDILSNEGVIKIFNDDVLLDTIDIKTGVEIPYILKVYNKTYAIEKKVNSEIIKNFPDSKIIVEQSKNILNELFDVDFFGSLENLSGFCQIENFNMQGVRTKTEYDELKRILETGFYI